ncbi:hypothetical protein [Streptomyces mangrovisoli]|uniref:CopC domain-containing protein n=1 Tax=Streptomyces mangrovisoli TaxID=1428628 RepID=A0A1J4NVG6_9ACTN|nr:hypothetical protein [Streptomyces mangrovisoli]OIJ66288.1 hypothetical protein WN71_018965 [Streptomyces mangrovisoli]
MLIPSRPRRAGARIAAAAVLTAAASSALAGAPAAVAAPGDNGDVKIHEVGTPFTDERNQPKVCHFYLDAFAFDTVQRITWTIETQPTVPGGPTRNGGITLVGGVGHTEPVADLPDGMYKLTWQIVGGTGAGKHKVFQVDCQPSSASPSPSGSAGSPGPSASPVSTGRPTGRPTGPVIAPNGGPPAGGGGLARSEAFSPVAGAAAVGLATVAGVVWYRLRRRTHGAS